MRTLSCKLVSNSFSPPAASSPPLSPPNQHGEGPPMSLDLLQVIVGGLALGFYKAPTDKCRRSTNKVESDSWKLEEMISTGSAPNKGQYSGDHCHCRLYHGYISVSLGGDHFKFCRNSSAEKFHFHTAADRFKRNSWLICVIEGLCIIMDICGTFLSNCGAAFIIWWIIPFLEANQPGVD